MATWTSCPSGFCCQEYNLKLSLIFQYIIWWREYSRKIAWKSNSPSPFTDNRSYIPEEAQTAESRSSSLVSVGGGHQEDMTTRWPKRAGLRQWEAPHPLPCPYNIHFAPPFPQLEPFSRMQTWESNVLLNPSEQYAFSQVRLLYKLLRFWRVGVEFYSPCSRPRQASWVDTLAY